MYEDILCHKLSGVSHPCSLWASLVPPTSFAQTSPLAHLPPHFPESTPVRSCLSTPMVCGRKVMERLGVFWGVYLSGSTGCCSSGINMTIEKSVFLHIWADWVISLSAETRCMPLVFLISSVMPENTSQCSQRAENYNKKVYCVSVCSCCFRIVFDGFNQATEGLTSGSSFDPCCCCRESLRDGSGIRRELGSFDKQAVTRFAKIFHA